MRKVIAELNDDWNPLDHRYIHVDKKYKNNRIETDHAALKRLLKLGKGSERCSVPLLPRMIMIIISFGKISGIILMRLLRSILALSLMVCSNAMLAEEPRPELLGARHVYICNANSNFTNVRAGPSAKDFETVYRVENSQRARVINNAKNDYGFVYFEIEYRNRRIVFDRNGWVYQNLLSSEPCTEENLPLVTDPGGDPAHPLRYTDGQCYVVLASRKNPFGVNYFINHEGAFPEFGRIFLMSNDWYALVWGVSNKREFKDGLRDAILSNYRNAPKDILCSEGAEFEEEVPSFYFDDPPLVALESFDGERLSLANREDFYDLELIPYPEKLGELLIPHSSVYDFSPLSQMVNLWSLDVGDTSIQELTPLSNLTKLRSLRLSNTNIDSLAPLNNLTDMRALVVSEAPYLADISGIENMRKLTSLTVSGSWETVDPISDISAVEDLTELVSLDFYAIGPVSDIAPLAGLQKLESLRIADNYNGGPGRFSIVIDDLSPIQNLTALKDLDLSFVTNDISPLKNLSSLTALSLDYNGKAPLSLEDIGGLTNLESLTVSSDYSSEIDIEPLKNLTQLKFLNIHDPINSYKEKRKTFRLNITDISPIGALSDLRGLYLSFTDSDLGPLENLQQLDMLRLDYNGDSALDLSPLASLTNLNDLSITVDNLPEDLDISPLATMQNLKRLNIESNVPVDETPLAALEANGLDISTYLIDED